MEVAEQKFTPAMLPTRAASRRVVPLRNVRPLVVLSFLFCASIVGRSDVYDSALERRFAEPKGSTNTASASPATDDPKLAAVLRALKAEQRVRSEGPPPPPPKRITLAGWMLLSATALTVLLVVSKLIKLLNDRIKNRRWLSKEAEEALLREKLIAEQPSLVAFFNELRFGLGTEIGALPADEIAEPQMGGMEEVLRLSEFFDFAPGLIASLRKQFSKISRTSEKVARVELLREFFCLLDALKRKATMPELRAARLMACGLEGLVQQLSMTAANINPSVLRTAAGAVDLLETLCVPGVDPNLATRTPVELLAVDDNPVCLSALSMALKKAFREPDVAVDGTSGLVLAEKKRYDVAFLDLEMPGLNGFELCSKIRESKLNPTTPVVFVTSHSDFNSRAKSTLVGGQDLIAKPYLSFEITVKALTLAFRGRLAADESKAEPVVEKTPALEQPEEIPA